MSESPAPESVSSLQPSVVLRFPPQRSFVTRAASLVRCFCAGLIGDGDALSRVNMVAHELVENVVKYSNGGICELRVDLHFDGRAPVVRIETTNAVADEGIEDFDRLLVAVQETPDPVAFYDCTIRASAKRQDGSGLGLARIRAEGEMDLSHQFNDGRVTIRAEAVLTGVAWMV